MNANIMKETYQGIQTVSAADELCSTDRVISFTEEVTPESCAQLISLLMILDKTDTGSPITLILNSAGGDICSGLAVYDTVRSLTGPVNTAVMGTASGISAVIFLAGEQRLISPHSRITLCDPAVPERHVRGLRPSELKDGLDRLLDERGILAGIISERTGRSTEEITRRTASSQPMTAAEALSFGMATEIGVPSALSIRKQTS